MDKREPRVTPTSRADVRRLAQYQNTAGHAPSVPVPWDLLGPRPNGLSTRSVAARRQIAR